MTTSGLATAPFDGGAVRSFYKTYLDHNGRLKRQISSKLHVQARRFFPVEDVLQEVWLAAYRKWDTYSATRAPIRAWLNGICYHKLCDVLRRFYLHAARMVYAGDALNERAASARQAFPFPAADLEDFREVVHTCTSRLTPEQRGAFLLICMHGLSAVEAGSMLRIEPDAACQRAARGMKTFCEVSKPHMRRFMARFERLAELESLRKLPAQSAARSAPDPEWR